MPRRVLALVVLSVGLFQPAKAYAAPVDAATANSLWVAEQDGVMRLSSTTGDLILEVRDVDDVRAVGVDLRRRTIWAFSHRTVYAFDFAGQRQVALPVSTSDSIHAALAVVPADGAVWLAVGQDLLNIGAGGQLLNSARLAGNVVALKVDPAAGLLWVATGSTIQALDLASGLPVRSITVPSDQAVVALDPEVDTGRIWVALSEEVRLHGPSGELLMAHGARGVTQVAADLADGAWVSTTKTVTHLSGAGIVISSSTPFDGTGTIARLVSAGDRTVWLANQSSIAHLSAAGATLQRLSFQPPVRIRDLAVNSDATPPELSIVAPPAGACLADLTPTIQLSFSDIGWGVAAQSIEISVNGTVRPAQCSADEGRATCELASPLAEGPTVVTVVVQDYAGNLSAAATTELTLDATAPKIIIDSPDDGAVTDRPEVTIEGRLSEPATLRAGEGAIPVASNLTFSYGPVELREGENVFHFTATDCAGNRGEKSLRVSYEPGGSDVPPDPATVATPLDPAVATDIAAATEFLYSGARPVQEGVAPGTIDPERVAVLRGRVIDREGNPLPQVKVTILDHPEFGSTASREDGLFDLAVNGGGPLVVSYEKEGFFPAQRPVEVPWRDYAWVEDVALIQPDAAATVVSAGAPTMQVARGSEVHDQDGIRRPTVLFPAATVAEMVLADGSRKQLATLTVRASEYTVGPRGPAAMPGPLPAGVAYTHAVELSVDEAISAAAKSVVFTRPVVYFIENFLAFPVGGPVPVGYYDRAMGTWLPSNDGRVIKVLAVTDGVAELDVTGSGTRSDQATLSALGITDEEARQLALLYTPGQSLWRVAISHFTPLDCNWPYGPPPDAEPPNRPEPDTDDREDDPCDQSGSIIECQNQTLGESLPIVGTSLSLNYRSDRVPGRKGNHAIDIPLTGSSVPASLKRVDLQISVAGRQFLNSFSRQPNQRYLFTWDGKDAYGRLLNGRQPITVEIGYVYDAVYQAPVGSSGGGSGGGQSWGQLSGVPITGSRVRQEVTIWQVSHRQIGSWAIPPSDLGGWSLSPYHYYDQGGPYLFLGNGERVHATTQAVSTVAGPGSVLGDGGPATSANVSPYGIDFAPDGRLFVADRFNGRIRVVTRDGMISTFAGGGTFAWDGLPALQSRIFLPTDVAVAPDGSVYFVDHPIVRKVNRAGIVNTVYAPTNVYSVVSGIDVDGAGNLYIVDSGRSQIIRLDPSGRQTVIAGTGNDTGSTTADNIPASQVRLTFLHDVTVDHRGNVYFTTASRVRKVGTNGLMTFVSGPGQVCADQNHGDGGPANLAFLCSAYALAVGPDDSLYVGDYIRLNVRRISPEGIITTVAGNAAGTGSRGDGAPATATRFIDVDALAFDPRGLMYIADRSSIRKVGFYLPGYSLQPATVASGDGRQLYFFDNLGRHTKSVDTLSGQSVYEFGRDAAGRLVSIRDVDGAVTRIERSSSGQPLAIVSPHGLRTALTTGSGGYLATVRNPAGETVRLVHADDGLLTSLTDPRDKEYQFSYDLFGRLWRDEDPAGGSQTLTRTPTSAGFRVDIRSAEGRTRSYTVENLSTDDRRWYVSNPSGTYSVLFKNNGSLQLTQPDGSTWTEGRGPDPRFGMQSSIPDSLQVRSKAGLTLNLTRTVSAGLADASNPLSMRTLQETTVQNGRTFTRLFDNTLRQLSVTSSQGRKRIVVYDAKGRPLSSSVSGLAPISFEYDAAGRLSAVKRVAGPEQREVRFEYGAEGWLAKLTSGDGELAFAYDLAGRPRTASRLGAGAIGLSYDPAGNLASVAPPGRPLHEFSFDDVGLVSTYSPPGVGDGAVPTSYHYDRDRELLQMVRPSGQLLDVGRDGAGRVATVTFSRGQIAYSYNNGGRISRVAAPGETVDVNYDSFLPTRSVWSGTVGGSVELTFDNDFRVSVHRVNGLDAVAYQYDRDSLVTRAGALVITHDLAHGLPTATTLGQVSTASTYNPFGEIARTTASFGAVGFYAVDYTYDAVGRIRTKQEAIGSESVNYSYAYDSAGRLATVSRDGAQVAGYVYDANGNRTSFVSPSGTVDFSYDLQDRVVSRGTTLYLYSKNGDLSAKTEGGSAVTYTYDERGDLIEAVLPDGIRIEYVLDGQHRRVGKKVNGVLTQGFLYQDWLRPIAELNGTGGVVSRFVYGARPNVPDYMVRGGVTYRIVADHLGSPRLVVDASSGVVAQRMDFDEFGRVVLDTNPGFQPFGFAGGLYDPQTGLVRFGFRDYDPVLGRWTSKDPVGFRGGDANLYAYTWSDPVNHFDPVGLWGFGVQATASGEAGVAVGVAAQEGVGAGVFGQGLRNPSAGVYVEGGILAGGLGHGFGRPSNEGGVLGGSLSAGLSLFFTNADCLQELAGPFTNYNLTVGVGPFQGSLSYFEGGGIKGINVGLPGMGATLGASASSYQTYTVPVGDVP